MNRIPLSRRVQIINRLVEGNSIRSTERRAATHRDTICVGMKCKPSLLAVVKYGGPEMTVDSVREDGFTCVGATAIGVFARHSSRRC